MITTIDYTKGRLIGGDEDVDVFALDIDVQDVLTSEDPEDALSANMGRILNESLTSVTDEVGDTGYDFSNHYLSLIIN